jgi:hypothetical protein
MAADLLSLLTRVARALESAVPELWLVPAIGDLVWLENKDAAGTDDSELSTGATG